MKQSSGWVSKVTCLCQEELALVLLTNDIMAVILPFVSPALLCAKASRWVHFAGVQDVRDLYTFEEDKPALGQGSYGLVMKVTHKQTNKPYACKILYVSRASVNGAKEITKLHSEVSIMRELDHPHIVRLREVFYAK